MDKLEDLENSYRIAQSITKERAKNFYYGIKLLPEEKRRSLCAVYAFFRESDDLSDEEGVQDRASSLARWKALIRDRSKAQTNPILPAFHHSVDSFQIPLTYFEELMDGTTSDLKKTRCRNFEELYTYCYQVASTVGLVCLHIFGFDGSTEALKKAEERGIAFQLTNILRDLREDAERGRIYLPLDELERFGLTETEFLEGRGEGLQALLSFQIERAKAYYCSSQDLTQLVAPESRASLQAMTDIYRAVLAKVEDLGLGVFQERARLSKVEKLALAGRSALQNLRNMS